jgi:hypothetical protein
MPKKCLARNATFGNWPSWLCYQRRSLNVEEGMDNLLNKDNSPMTSAQEDSSKDVPTPNMLPFSSRSSWLVDVQVSTIWFRASKNNHWKRNHSLQIILRSKLNCIIVSTKISTTRSDLNQGSNIITSILWTWFE